MNRTAVVIVSALGTLAATAHGQGNDDVLESRIAECVKSNDGNCLEEVAAFDEAARAYEVAGGHGETSQASEEVLLKSIRLRYALGQRSEANAAVLAFLKVSPKSRHVDELATLTLSAGAADPTELAQHLDFYLRALGTRGGWDRYVVARVKLGALLMKASCPVDGYFGACVALSKVRTECPRFTHEQPWMPPRASDAKVPFYWGEVAKQHARDAKQLREAKQHLSMALAAATLRKAEKDAQGQASRRQMLANARGEGLRLLATEDWDAYVALDAMPFDLDFTQPAPDVSVCDRQRQEEINERSNRRFMRWLEDKTARADKLRGFYKRAIAQGGPESSVAASAYIALVLERYLEAMDHGLQSPECRSRDVFVEASNGLWSIEEKLTAAVVQCEKLSDAFAVGSDLAVYCRRQLGLLRPSEYPRADELFLSQVEEETDLQDVTIPKVDAPPRLQPKPSRRPCKAPAGLRSFYESSSTRLATIFGPNTSGDLGWLPFSEDFFATLKTRFELPHPGWR